MAWQSSTINPATTSPAADITKITNDLQQLRTVLGGGTDGDIPLTPAGAIFGNSGVLIGLTPGRSGRLEVRGNTNADGNQSNSSDYGLQVTSLDNSTYLGITHSCVTTVGARPLVFGTGNIEAMRIDTSRNVGIGTSPPSWGSSYRAVNLAQFGTRTAGIYGGTGVTGLGFVIGASEGGSGWTYSATSAPTARYEIDGSGNHVWFTGGTGTAGSAVTWSERVRVDGTGAVFFPGVGTTASAANAFINNASSPVNQLLRSTSSARYKKDVEDVAPERVEAAITGLRPVWYRSKAEADNKAWSWYGLIAEEVAEVEPRLVHWSYTNDAYEEIEVEYEAQEDGETVTKTRTERRLKEGAQLAPDGVQYERLAVLLLAEVQRLRAANDNLEARLAVLESK